MVNTPPASPPGRLLLRDDPRDPIAPSPQSSPWRNRTTLIDQAVSREAPLASGGSGEAGWWVHRRESSAIDRECRRKQ